MCFSAVAMQYQGMPNSTMPKMTIQLRFSRGPESDWRAMTIGVKQQRRRSGAQEHHARRDRAGERRRESTGRGCPRSRPSPEKGSNRVVDMAVDSSVPAEILAFLCLHVHKMALCELESLAPRGTPDQRFFDSARPTPTLRSWSRPVSPTPASASPITCPPSRRSIRRWCSRRRTEVLTSDLDVVFVALPHGQSQTLVPDFSSVRVRSSTSAPISA